MLEAWNMSGTANQNEAQLARECKDRLFVKLTRKRDRSLLIAILAAVAAVAFWLLNLVVVSFCVFVVSVIFLVRYFDANSHRHEVSRRSDSMLVPDLSILKSNSDDQSAPLDLSTSKQTATDPPVTQPTQHPESSSHS